MPNRPLTRPIDLSALPPGVFRTGAVLAVAAFAGALLFPFLSGDGAPAVQALPLAVVGAIWIVPVGLALARGSRGAFIFYLALLIFMTDANFRSRPWYDKSFDWQVLMKGSVWMAAGAIGVYHMRHWFGLLGRPPIIFAVAFLAFLGASCLWSPNTSYAILSSAAFLCMFVFALAAAQFLDERDLMIALALGLGMIVVPSLVMWPFSNSLGGISPGSTGELDRLRGMVDHPIPLADAASLFSLLCLMLVGRLRGWGVALVILFAIGITTLALTQSRVPPLALIIAFTAAWSYRKGGWKFLLPVALVGGGIYFLLGAAAGFNHLLPYDLMRLISRSGTLDEVLSLSGRLLIWDYTGNRIAEAPFFGHGHASGPMVFRDYTLWSITHAHNAYLQALLYLGIVGAGLLLLTMAAQMRIFLTQPSLFRDTLFLYEAVKGFTEQSMLSNLPGSGTLIWMLALAMGAIAVERARRARRYRLAPGLTPAGSAAETVRG